MMGRVWLNDGKGVVKGLDCSLCVGMRVCIYWMQGVWFRKCVVWALCVDKIYVGV